MLVRSLIVLLVVLNLGAGAWWLLHAPPPARVVAAPAGVPRLQLLEETRPGGEVAAVARRVAPAASTQATAADAGNACTGAEAGAEGWRVDLPPLPDAAAAETLAARIGEAGFSDLLVVHEGEAAHSVALGRYGTRDAAQRRVDALRAAGFPARCARIEAASPH